MGSRTRHFATIHRMHPGTFGGQSRIATPASYIPLQSSVVAQTSSLVGSTPHYSISGYVREFPDTGELAGHERFLWWDLSSQSGHSGVQSLVDEGYGLLVPQEVAAYDLSADPGWGSPATPSGVADAIGLPEGSTLSNLSLHFDWSPATGGTPISGSVYLQVLISAVSMQTGDELWAAGSDYVEIGSGVSDVDMSLSNFEAVPDGGGIIYVTVHHSMGFSINELAATSLEFGYVL